MSHDFDNYSASIIPSIEQEMRSVLKADSDANSPFYGMIHYHMGWSDQEFRPIKKTGGGKRIRPLLCTLCCEAAGGSWQMAVSGAAALEILHNFTLIHDDIEDASPTRRGRPTVWHIWGAEQAINVGDAMFALAHVALLRLSKAGVPADRIGQAINRMDETCLDLTFGQYSDMDFEKREKISVQDYIDMITGKTAALISFSCELGALIAGCSPSTVKHYAAFGRHLGLAFQIRDDILGIWGDESIIGKSAATDISTRKKSLPVLYGLEQNPELYRLYEDDRADDAFVSRTIALLDEVKAKEYAEMYEARYANDALEQLEVVQAASPAKELLLDLVQKLLNRQS